MPMKRWLPVIFCSAAVMLSLVWSAGSLAQALGVLKDENLVLATDFSADAVGSPPSGWDVWGSVPRVVADAEASGGKAVQLVPSTEKWSSFSTVVTADAPLVVVEHGLRWVKGEGLNYYITGPGNAHYVNWFVRPQDGAGILMYRYDDGRVETPVGPLQDGWNRVRVVAHAPRNEAYVYLNDFTVPAIGPLPFRTPTDYWRDITVSFAAAQLAEPARLSESYYDYVKVWAVRGEEADMLLFASGDNQALPDDLKELFGLPADRDVVFHRVATSPDKGFSAEQVAQNAPDIVALDVAHLGGNRLLFRVQFGHPVRLDDGSVLHIYLDLDDNRATGRADSPSHAGVDIMITASQGNVSVSSHNPAYAGNAVFAGGVIVDDTYYAVLEAPLHGDADTVRFTVHLLSERSAGGRKIGQSDSTPRQLVEIPRSPLFGLLPLDRQRLASLKPLSAFRYIGPLVKYESLSNKGISYSAVAVDGLELFGRERPAVPLALQVPEPGKEGSVERRRVAVSLLEEGGVARFRTPVTFGFPLPQGAVYDLAHFRLLTASEEEIAAQFTATAYWPDDSLKWVLIDFTPVLEAGAEDTYYVEFGHDVSRVPSGKDQQVTVEETADSIVVTTGPLRAKINKNQFKLFDAVWLDKNGDGVFAEHELVAWSGDEGIGLVDEHGRLYTTSALPPESVRIEEAGDHRVIVRVEGQYGLPDGETYMRYVTRLTFRSGSARVQVAHTHINDYLETEFTDITSLYIPLEVPEAVTGAVFTGGSGEGLTTHSGTAVRLFQRDEKTAVIDGKTIIRSAFWQPGLSPGVARIEGAKGSITAVIHDFQERWPKGLAILGTRLLLELLPEQPDAAYGTDLPDHLRFPFVEGKYRFKWGNSVTERITLDFSGQTSAEEMAAEGRWPVVAVLPAEWYDETGVFGPIALVSGERMEEWNRFVADSYNRIASNKIAKREFGYFNYGDWHGERGRNWGNNEYDLAHGFFMEFVRTGDRRYYRLALAAARHQADIDIIHAYPDPTFIGANAQHSIGHTGEWSERVPQATWSKAFDRSFTAANGHTWVDGMLDAWFLAGDARVMESALALGEHIIWAMAPEFNALGTHERSAGWSLRALIALYRSTYDPLYLDAARRIAAVALRDQDLGGSGAWPHPLPTDHSGNRPGAVGNNLLMIGILLGGLQAFHQETQDPAVLRSIEAGVEWVLRSWDPDAKGWPYSATVEGEPLYAPSSSRTPLVVPALAYVASLRDDVTLLQVVDAAMEAYVRTGPKADGKGIAQALYFSAETLARLSRLPDWFRPRLLEWVEPRAAQQVAGVFPVEIRMLSDESDRIEAIELDVDGTVVYGSDQFPEGGRILVDSLPFSDGAHTLKLTVAHRDYGTFQLERRVTVANTWTLVLNMAPPVSSGWFGDFVFDYLQTESRSAGWTYDTSNAAAFAGDPHRLVRATDQTEYLIWKTNRLQTFAIELYVRGDISLGDGLELAVSADGTEWVTYDFEPEVSEKTGEWTKLLLTGRNETQGDWNWFRLTLAEQLPKEAVQIGHIIFTGLRSE